MRRKPYCIVSPDYDFLSGGIKVMWGLYGHLLARGEEVYINRRPSLGDCVGIYPEIMQGNPAETSTVVRYLLNKPGFMQSNGVAGPTIFNKSDKLVAFSRVFYDKPDLFMFLPVINTKVFKDQGKKRNKKAVFYGKWRGSFHPEDCIELDRSKCQDQQALADILNECEVIYIYDQVTAMYEITRLCGCRVVAFPMEVTEEELKQYEPGLMGISFNEDKHQSFDVEAFTGHYKGLQGVFQEQLSLFIDLTQS